MKCREYEMACLCRGERNPHRFRIAHLADDDHVRSLPDSGTKSGGKVWRVNTDFDLLHHAALVNVFVLDRIFDRDDVPCLAAIDVIDESSQRRRLSGTGWAADQDQPARQLP